MLKDQEDNHNLIYTGLSWPERHSMRYQPMLYNTPHHLSFCW